MSPCCWGGPYRDMQIDHFEIDELLPHAQPMILLDELVEVREDGVDVVRTVAPRDPFFVPGRGVPSYVGLEYMAQSCGVFAGLQSRLRQEPVQVGFLLGTRNFHAALPWFPEHERLVISVHEILRQPPMGVFECRIHMGAEEVATATLNLYSQQEGSEVTQDNA